MTATTTEFAMPDIQTGAGVWGTIAAGLTAATAILYTLWSKINLSRTSDDTESEALRMLKSAVDHWKGLYDVMTVQVSRERDQRVLAERRCEVAVEEVEGLRSEVAALRREIERLSAAVAAYSKGAT